MRLSIIRFAYKIAKYRKSLSCLLLISILTTTTLLVALSIVGQSYQEIQKRKDLYLYGFFDAIVFDDQSNQIDSIKNLIKPEETGTMAQVGSITASKDKTISFGTMDEKLLKASSLTLFKGRYPQNSKEIAIERSTYEKYYADYQIGQTVDLKIDVPRNDGQKSMIMSYSLVGIVENYTQIWNQLAMESRTDSSLHFTLNIFTMPDPNQTEFEPIRQAYTIYYLNEMDIDNTLVQMEKQLRYPQSAMINNYKLEYLANQDNQTFLVYLIPILMILTILLILNAYSQNAVERQKLSRTLYSIGMQASQIFRLQIYHAIMITLLALPVGLILGLLLAYGSLTYISQSFNVPLVFVIEPRLLFISAGVILSSAILASLVPALSDQSNQGRVKRRTSGNKRMARNKYVSWNRQAAGKMRFNPYFAIAARILRKHRFRTMTASLTIIAAMTLFAFVIANLSGEMKLMSRTVGADFTVYYTGNAEQSNISAETIESMRALPGISKLDARKSDYAYQLFQSNEVPEYFKLADRAQPVDVSFNSAVDPQYDTAVQFNIDGISWEMLRETVPAPIFESLDFETFQSGQSAILSLGLLYELEDGQIYCGDPDELPPGIKIVREHSYDGLVKAGDTITFYREDQKGDLKQFDIKIAAIIDRSVNQLYIYEGAMAKYGLCNQYANAAIYFDNTADTNAVKNQLYSLIADNQQIGVFDRSEAAERQRMQVLALYSQQNLLIVLLAVVGLLSLIVLSVSQIYNQQRQLGLYMIAGMSSRQLLMLFMAIGLIGSLGAVLAGCIIAGIFVSGYYYFYIREAANLAFLQYFPFVPLICCGLSILLVNVLSILYPVLKMTGQEPNSIIRMNEERSLM